jgi:hypothetical protein
MQFIQNLALDRHTLPPGLKYGSDTKNQTLPKPGDNPGYWLASDKHSEHLAAGRSSRVLEEATQ